MITAQVVLINKEGLVLGVSRKTDHNDFGLPGGKEEPEDSSDAMLTAYRETLEETGLKCSNFRLVLAIHKDGYMSYTYLADYEGEINHNEPHVVKWLSFSELIAGSFGKYNQLVSESLDDMGVKYLKAIKPKKEYIFTHFVDKNLEYCQVVISPKDFWVKNEHCPDNYKDSEWDDIYTLCKNGNINISEDSESFFSVSKNKKMLKTHEEIHAAMINAGFIFDLDFFLFMNS